MAGNYRTVIKRFSDNYFSVTQLKHAVSGGIKNPFKEVLDVEKTERLFGSLAAEKLKSDIDEKEKEKIKENLIRARTRIFEIAMCNDWELFGTFTIDPNKYNRYQLGDFYKAFSQYIQNLNKRNGYCIKYLLIPEMHKDGAWHLHGMFMGIPEKGLLLPFSFNRKLPRYIRNQLKKHRTVYDWPGYRHRFGFCDLEPIRKKEACCKYIVKYITKDLERSVRESGSKVYYCSQGLNRPIVVYEGEDADKIVFPHHSNVWIDRKDFFDFSSALEYSSIKFFDSFLSAGLDDGTIDRILSA